jgi:hypothetical protein
MIVVSDGHRNAVFDACRYIIDTIKQTVPIWKKEIFEDGEEWVSPIRNRRTKIRIFTMPDDSDMKTNTLENKSVQKIDIVKVKGNESFPYTDDLSVEEPLEIRFLMAQMNIGKLKIYPLP